MTRLANLILLLVVAGASAFSTTPAKTWGGVSVRTSSSARFMFSTDKDEKKAPPQPVEDLVTSKFSAEGDAGKNIVKDMNTGEIKEVKWVDPAMRANTKYVTE